MAGKKKSMKDIKQIIIMYYQNRSIGEIARSLSISKNTVKNYLKKLKELGIDSQKDPKTYNYLLSLDDFEIEKELFSGNPSFKEERYQSFTDQLNYFKSELKRTGVTRYLLWKEYRDHNLEGYSYSQFCYHLNQQIKSSRPSMVLDHLPGDKLYVDFSGKKMHYVDKETGEQINCEIFVACLPFSDYGYALAVRSQSSEDFFHALSQCLIAIGGVPKAIVPDNLKAAVTTAHKYEPKINQSMKDFGNHYGLTVIPARAYKPKDKALVENQVKLVYSRVFAPLRNEIFFTIEDLNKAISIQMKKHNQTRMQRKPYCREEQFLSKEKPLLGKLRQDKFEIKQVGYLKVAQNNHIYISEAKLYYSVPHRFIGKKVTVTITRKVVCVYYKQEQIAMHIRSKSQQGYVTKKDHLCSTHKSYKDRSPKYYIDRSKHMSPKMNALFIKIFSQGKYPEILYRTCDGIISLYRKNHLQTFERAVEICLEHQEYSYTFIKRIIENKMTNYYEDYDVKIKPLPGHKNIRGKQYYN